MKYLTLIRGTKNTLLWSIAMLFPVLLMLLGRAMGSGVTGGDLIIKMMNMYSLLSLFYFMPWAMCVAATTGGLITMLVGLFSCFAVMFTIFGVSGLIFSVVLFLVPAAVFTFVTEKQVDFKKAVLWLTGSYVVTRLLSAVVLTMMSPNGDVFSAAALAVSEHVKDTGTLGEYLLYALKQYGLAGVNSASIGQAVGDIVYSMVPGLMTMIVTELSLLSGIGGLALSQHCGRKSLRRRGEETRDFPSMNMPLLRKWLIPKGWGAGFGVMAVGYLMQTFAGSNLALFVIGGALWYVFYSVYILQGLALLNYIQHTRGTAHVWRVILPILLVCIVPISLVVLGVIDQVSDPRRLRSGKADETEENESDEGGQEK